MSGCCWVVLIVCLVTAAIAQVQFTRRTPAELGIDTVFSYISNSFVDYDRDGWLDFFSFVVYRNEGTGHFRRLDSTRIFEAELCDWADFDGDGLPDMLTNRKYGGNTYDTNFILIYRNEGPPDWTLRNIADSLGLGREETIFDRDLVDPCWFDYDGDGWLDFYLTSYEWPYNSGQGRPDYLFHSEAGERFTDVSESAGVAAVALCSRGASLFDFDEDGDVDIFVAVYRLQPNLLWQNNGDGTFTDVAEEKGVQGLYIGGYYGHNIGAAIADYNNDGHLDIFTPITHHTGYPGDSTGHLWINNGPPNWDFTCHFAGSGLVNTEIGANPTCGDFDNDGDVDIVYTNLYGAPAPNTYLFRNDGNLHFTDVTDSVGLTPRMRTNYTYFVDYNNDGFLDVFWARYDGSTYHYEFFENGGNSNHWLELDLVGNYPNTNAIGARIDAWAGELYLVREVLHNQGMHYGDAFIARQHLGLGGASRVDSLIIRWPDRTSQRLYNLPVDTILQITQSQPGVEEKSPITLPVRFVNKTALSGINGLLFDVTGRRTNPIGVKAGIFYLRTPDSNRWVKLVLY
ncbi:MAG: CRTAC1 family protein [candidate division WOR-3 bacterium]